MNKLKDLLTSLIACASVTPDDSGCQEIMITWLERLGFKCQRLNNQHVSNFYAQIGTQGPLLLFAGHTDVVPAGDLGRWHSPPFELHEHNGCFYGRGVADMKGSLACMLLAAERWIEQKTQHNSRLGFLITSGEEGDDFELGTPYVMQYLSDQGIHPDFCIVGEPSSMQDVGDMIRIGRRGSLTAHIRLNGKQGHVAYPHLTHNQIHRAAPILHELTNLVLDTGNEHFPPSSLQITRLHTDNTADNVIPGDLTIHLNIRYSTEQTVESLQKTIEHCWTKHGVTPKYQWRHNGAPFLTPPGAFIRQCCEIIESHTQKAPILSTGGGTSDARFIAPYGVDVIELGPVNASIHQDNECVSIADLNRLTEIYLDFCHKLIG